MKKLYKLFWILLFLIGMAVPTFHINKAKISEQENRTLAKFPKIKKQWNYEYGKEFEIWLGDRFWGREGLITLHDKINYINKVIQNKKAVFFKKNGWMFNKRPFFEMVSKKKINSTLKRIQKFDKFCKNNGIKLYILVVPFKEDIYFDLYENSGKVDQTNEYLASLTPIHKKLGNTFIFPYKELKKASQEDFVFFKTSHHWTDYGAYIGYSKLIDSVQKDFPDIKKVSLNKYNKFKNKMIRDDWNRDFHIGYTAKSLLHIEPSWAVKNILKTDYVYYNSLNELKPRIIDIPGYKIKHFKNADIKNGKRVFLTGFSQNDNLLQFLPYSFSEVKYYRLNNVKKIRKEDINKFMKRYQKDLLKYKPDILVFTINMRKFFSNRLWEIE